MAYTKEQVASAITKKWYARWWGIALIAFLGFLVLLAGWFFYVYIDVTGKMLSGEYDARQFPEAEAPPYVMEQYLSGTEPHLGPTDAPIQVIEFGDFQCPQCQRSFSVMRELAAAYPDQVVVYWKHFPVINEDSIDFAKAAECAHQQNLFWPVHDRLFLGQGSIGPADLTRIASQAGVDVATFQSCYSNVKTLKVIQRDFRAAELIQASGTPTFLINGYKVEGFVPLSVWEDILSKLEN
jgi:protein-disulfide isomerase